MLDTSTGEDRIVFNTGTNTVKGRALRRDPRFALCVDVQSPPFSFVMFYATASIVDDPAASLPWSVRIGARYMGEEQGEEFGRRNAVPGELLILGGSRRSSPGQHRRLTPATGAGQGASGFADSASLHP